MKVLNAAPLLRPLDSGRPVVTSSPLLTSIRPAFRMRRGSARVACDASVSEKLEVPRPLQPDEFMRVPLTDVLWKPFAVWLLHVILLRFTAQLRTRLRSFENKRSSKLTVFV
jgi:hypothetical protein